MAWKLLPGRFQSFWKMLKENSILQKLHHPNMLFFSLAGTHLLVATGILPVLWLETTKLPQLWVYTIVGITTFMFFPELPWPCVCVSWGMAKQSCRPQEDPTQFGECGDLAASAGWCSFVVCRPLQFAEIEEWSDMLKAFEAGILQFVQVQDKGCTCSFAQAD